MRYRYIEPEELSKYTEVFAYAEKPLVLKFATGLLRRVSTLLGFPVFIGLPPEVVLHKKQSDQLRAMRIVKRLQETGYIEHSNYIINHEPDEPPAHILIHSPPNDNGFGWSGKSAHTTDRDYLAWPALGELVERYSVWYSYFKKTELIRSSYNKLTKPKVDIFAIAGFTESEKKSSTAPYKLGYSADDVFLWVPVTEVATGKKIFAPWQWFSFTYLSCQVKNVKNEPLLTPPITTGAAAGQTLKHALLGGLLEVIERDAFIIYWLQQLQAKKIDLESIDNTELRKLVQLAKKHRLELHVLYLHTDVPVHTISLVIVDRTGAGPAVNIGAKTGFDLTKIIIDTVQDQLAQRGLQYGMDRTYPDMVDVPVDQLTHVSRFMYWQKTEQIPNIEYFIAGDLSRLEDLPQYDAGSEVSEQLTYLYDWFVEQKYPIYYREVISPELKNLCEGISVVIVKVPDMQPLYLEEQLKATGGTRLQSVPKELGLATWFDAHGEYYQVPHPFP